MAGENLGNYDNFSLNSSILKNSESDLESESKSAYALPIWTLALFASMFIALILVAIFGNAVIIWTVLGQPAMRTVTNYFLLNLAFADFINVTLNVPFAFVYVANGNSWYFGTAYCKIMTFIGNCVLSAIVFTFMSIAVERYMAILFPLRKRMSKRITIAILLATWMASALIASPPAVLAIAMRASNESDDDRTLCTPTWPDTTQYYYDVTLMAVNYGMPLSVLCLAYTRVCVVLWRQDAMLGDTANRQHQAESIKVKRKVVRMMITLVIVFAVAWIPMHSYFVVTSTGSHLTVSHWAPVIYLCAYWLAMSTSAINPCIYFAYSKRFRTGLYRLLKCFPCWRKTVAHYESAGSNNTFLSRHATQLYNRKISTTSTSNAKVTNAGNLVPISIPVPIDSSTTRLIACCNNNNNSNNSNNNTICANGSSATATATSSCSDHLTKF